MARLIAAFLCFATLAISPAIAGERPASVTPAEAAASIASNTPPQVLDVRQIEGSWLRWEAEALPVEGAPAPPAGDHDAAHHGDHE